MLECKVIIHDKYYWHSNISNGFLGTPQDSHFKEFKIYSSGFFDIIPDLSDKWGFRIVIGRESNSIDAKSKPDDDKMIKAMLLGIKISEL
jgi:hypothetical protein